MERMNPIPGWPGYYATRGGKIFSERRMEVNGRGGNHKSRYLSTSEHMGYLRVTLWSGKFKKTFKVHRLVALAWLPNPTELREVNHINGNRADNRVDNLEWVSASDNRIRQYGRVVKERDYWKERAERAEAFLRTLGKWKEEVK